MNMLTEEYVAIKTEKNTEKSILKREATIMKHLDGINGVPRMRNFGTWEKRKVSCYWIYWVLRYLN